MQYAFTIIAVNQNDLTPELVIDQHGVHGGPDSNHPPAITSDRAEVFMEWVMDKAPPCFSPDVRALKQMVDDCLVATFKIIRKRGERRSKPQILWELKNAGIVLWVTLEAGP